MKTYDIDDFCIIMQIAILCSFIGSVWYQCINPINNDIKTKEEYVQGFNDGFNCVAYLNLQHKINGKDLPIEEMITSCQFKLVEIENKRR